MKNRINLLPILLLGLLAPGAKAQTVPPVLTSSIIQVDVTDGSGTLNPNAQIDAGGTFYSSNPADMPVVTLTGGGSGPDFIPATVGSVTTSGGSITSITLSYGGQGYTSAPVVTISGGSDPSPASAASGAKAEFFLKYASVFNFPNPGAPDPNEAFGAAGQEIVIWALAVGTHPAAGFFYTFVVNGQQIGVTSIGYPAGSPGGAPWTPPLPGVYYISATTNDGANTTTTLPVRYFATGTAVVGPTQGGSLVPIGSSIVISATSTPQQGFVQRIDFYTDWTNPAIGNSLTPPAGATLIGSSYTYPYSIIYTPTGASGSSHLIKAVAYDNNGNVVPEAASYLDSEVITMVTPIGPLPTCVITTPATDSSIPIPDYGSDPSASIPISVTATARPGGTIAQVQLFIDGVLFGTQTTFPYTFKWSPKVVGLYNLTALATDDKNNVIASTSSSTPSQTPTPTIVSVGAIPSVAITYPSGGGTLTGGASNTVTASATANSLDPKTNLQSTISSIMFFQDGNYIGTATPPAPPAVDTGVYSVTFKAVQKVDPSTGLAEPSLLTAIATDSLGFTSTSAAVTVNVTSGGTGGGIIVGIPPTVSITAPANSATVVVNTPVTLSAAANAPNGNVASMTFFVDDQVFQTITQYPYSVTWTPANTGFYYISAQVVDNLSDKVSSTKVLVYVTAEPPPVVNMVTPSTGGTVTVGTGVTVTANATSPSGTIASVQFFANGISIGTTSTQPYTVSWTPTSSGVYTLTSIATDNSGETTTSSSTIVDAITAASGLGTTPYFGTYQGLTDGGRFAFIVVDGTNGTFISHSTSGSTKPVLSFTSDIPVSAGGSFMSAKVSGTASVSGVNGTLSANGELFIGPASISSGVTVASGYYTGNISSAPNSQVTGIVGGDGSLMVYISSGSFSDVADGSVDSSGAFSITTAENNTFVGKVDPAKGFLTGTLSGPSGGSVFGARVSGGTFSDGVLKNISTRGQAGIGANAMIAGFVVGGASPKQLLIRAVGPTLSTFGLSGAIASTQLQVFSGTTVVASNTGWSSTADAGAAVAAADTQVGAFALPSGSADSAIVGSFSPGSYTVQVTGLKSETGVALTEVYDMDGYSPFSSKKLVNVSTRGNVGTGSNVMIGGFSINGTAPKRLLIRGAGPGLAALGVSGSLATPHLQIFDSSQNLIRENYAWETGNDPALVSAAALSTGAFSFTHGSADSAVLIVLPPGTYTSVLSGASSATGIALVEVYEVP